jgi:choline-sulfatase
MKRILIIVMFGLMINGLTLAQEGKTKPNILFIMTDQQNFFTMKAYGNHLIQTPALNKLADQSLVFQNAYVTQPVCAPSRGSLVTGLFPHNHGVINNDYALSTDILTLPEMINDSEYQSAYIGKWHLGNEVFRQRGFNTWVSMEDGYYDEYSEGNDKNKRSDYHEWLVKKGYSPNLPNNNRFSRKFASKLPIKHCKPYFLQEKAIEFLENTGNQPFVMYVSFLEPHRPYTGPLNDLYNPEEMPLPSNFNDVFDDNDPSTYRKILTKTKELYGEDEKTYKELLAKYWGLVTQVDKSVGAIMDKLENLGLSENTIVVYTSDHGSMMGAHKLVSKDVMYEESVRIPYLLKYPSLGNKHRIVRERVSQIDIVPTLLDLLGNSIPEGLDGESLLPFLNVEELYNKDVFIEWHKPNMRTVISMDGWKLVMIPNDKSLLFNLNSDPLETTNLYYKPEYKEVISVLKKKIEDWKKKTKDDQIIVELND